MIWGGSNRTGPVGITHAGEKRLLAAAWKDRTPVMPKLLSVMPLDLRMVTK